LKNCKVVFVVLLTGLLLGCVFVGVAMAGSYRGYPTVALSVNGNAVQSDVPPIIIDGRTLVPLRTIAETLGATVTYNQQYNYAVITTGSNQAASPTSTTGGGKYDGLPEVGVLVNGQTLTGDVPPVILDGRTLVPVRMVAEALGCTVNYSNGAVTVTSSGASSTTSSGNSDIDSALQSAAQGDTDTPSGVTGESNSYNSLDSTSTDNGN
jgi:N-acetylmuramoyl-L-alanine amidase